MSVFHCIIFMSYAFAAVVNAEDMCIKKGPCSCEFTNGTGIDLSPTSKTTFFTVQTYEVKNSGAQYDFRTYYYHPCYDIVPQINGTLVNNTCSEPLSLCRYGSSMNLKNGTKNDFTMGGAICEKMGTTNTSQFSADGKSIIYSNSPSSSIVMLICAQTDDELHVYSTEEPNKIVLSFSSRNACMVQLEEPGRSFGSTLLIIFFSLVIFYLVLGICTKKFLMGATGIEVIPNLAFWSDLPNLVRDGWAYAVNGFKLPPRGAGPVTSPDPNSYDSI